MLEQTKYFTKVCKNNLVIRNQKLLVTSSVDHDLNEIQDTCIFRPTQRTLPWLFEDHYVPSKTNNLHFAHQGVASMQSRAQQIVFWPFESNIRYTITIHLLNRQCHMNYPMLQQIFLKYICRLFLFCRQKILYCKRQVVRLVGNTFKTLSR